MTRLFTVLFLIFTASNASAAQVSNLHQAQVPVATQSDQDRNRVAPDALKQAIIKVVGNRQAVNSADITALLADAKRYVDRYSYQQIDQDGDSASTETLAVNFIFDAKTLNNALERIGLPIWGENRPEILLWLASETNGDPRLIGENDDNTVNVLIEKHADRRGLPIVLPLMDLEDQTQISFTDIQSGNSNIINAASARYGARITLTAKIGGNPEQAAISWQAFNNDDNLRWQTEGTLDSAIAGGIDQLADSLGQRFAQQMGPPQQLAVEITDVKNYNDYNRLIAYLNNLQAVESVSVISMDNNLLKVDLTIAGDVSKFRDLLAFDGILQVNDAGYANNVEQYRLLP